jgi:mannose-6-phosphate isomerase-like protein (cupin superfamily)
LGALVLFYDGRTYRLERGDSAYLDSSHPHTFHGLGNSVAKNPGSGEFVRCCPHAVAADRF